MADVSKRSRADNLREMERLKTMYQRLPPEKQKAARVHMQARMNELQSAIEGKSTKSGRSGGGGFGVLQTVLLVVLASVVALGLGFFGVAYMAQ